jgi:asparagine synthase (glutamine-hydrolysing)
MCGILGQIELNKPINEELFSKMLDSLLHRGPDDFGQFLNAEKKIALGHRRLSFLDLSPAGKQPLSNTNKSIWITFNGEIYNYLELREQLKGKFHFNTETDTEVIIAAYQEWGIDCLQKIKGMFAFGLYDSNLNKLFLARDRFGIKPLYYAKINDTFLFGSELKALIASGIIPKQVDFSSFADYFVYRYIPSPKTIWQNVNKLPPAHYFELNTLTLDFISKEYWTLKSGETHENDTDLINEVNQILTKSVKEHTRADVPIGSFLSGG